MSHSHSRGRIRSLLSCILVATGGVAVLPVQAQDLEGDERRFVQIFIEDAALVENVWFEGQVRWQDLDTGDDLSAIGPVFVISPFDKLEFGGRVDVADIDLGPLSESGLRDMTIWGKWQLFHNPVQFTIGVELFLPTGDEDDLLGTGEFDTAVFAAVRKNLSEVYLTGHIGFRFNGDSNVGSNLGPGFTRSLDGKTSVLLGGGAMFPVRKKLAVSGELTVETERYEQQDSRVELTLGGYYFAGKHMTLRGALGFGLTDDSPDYELILGIVGHF